MKIQSIKRLPICYCVVVEFIANLLFTILCFAGGFSSIQNRYLFFFSVLSVFLSLVIRFIALADNDAESQL